MYLQYTVLACTAAVSLDLPYNWLTPLIMRKTQVHVCTSKANVSIFNSFLPLFRALSPALGLSSSDLHCTCTHVHCMYHTESTIYYVYTDVYAHLHVSPIPRPIPSFTMSKAEKLGIPADEEATHTHVQN